jgi:hypothetical protein
MRQLLTAAPKKLDFFLLMGFVVLASSIFVRP